MVNANAIAIAGGAIAASLIDTLTSKGLLTADEAAALGARALMLLTPYTMTSSDADGACRIITDMLVGPARPGA
jgi:dihydrodipicolinate synthase/N-acetylneuraminate lyase